MVILCPAKGEIHMFWSFQHRPRGIRNDGQGRVAEKDGVLNKFVPSGLAFACTMDIGKNSIIEKMEA